MQGECGPPPPPPPLLAAATLCMSSCKVQPVYCQQARDEQHRTAGTGLLTAARSIGPSTRGSLYLLMMLSVGVG